MPEERAISNISLGIQPKGSCLNSSPDISSRKIFPWMRRVVSAANLWAEGQGERDLGYKRLTK